MLKRLLNMFFPMFTDSSTREKPTLNSQVDQPKVVTARVEMKPAAKKAMKKKIKKAIEQSHDDLVKAPKKKRGRPPKAKK